VFIKEHIKLYILINDRKARWRKLGIENLSSMESLAELVAKNAIKVYLAAREQIKDENTHTAMRNLYNKVK